MLRVQLTTPNARGIAAMLLAVAAFCGMDVCLKTLTPHYSPFQVATIRALATLPVVVIWALARGGHATLVGGRWIVHLGRAIAGLATLSLFAYALRGLPLSEAYALFFVAPIFITVLAAWLLRERVDAHRWIAIGIGLAGVLVVLRPTGTGALTVYGLAILGSALGYALSNISVRVLGRTESTQSIMFWNMLLMAVLAGAVAAPAWRHIHVEHWKVIGAMAVVGSIAQWAITEAFRHAEASVVAPIEYTAMIWGVLLDWLVWNAVPGALTFVGAAIVIVSGIYVVRRGRAAAEAPASPEAISTSVPLPPRTPASSSPAPR